jgi:hypothetical protein
MTDSRSSNRGRRLITLPGCRLRIADRNLAAALSLVFAATSGSGGVIKSLRKGSWVSYHCDTRAPNTRDRAELTVNPLEDTEKRKEVLKNQNDAL